MQEIAFTKAICKIALKDFSGLQDLCSGVHNMLLLTK